MKFKQLRALFVVSGIFVSMSAPNLFGQQADALIEMLQRKGLLTDREAKEVKEQMVKDLGEKKGGAKIKVGSWLDELKINGDVRVRYAGLFDRQSPSTVAGSSGTFDDVDRDRYRLRLRVGLTAKAGDWETGFRLASNESDDGIADATSNNTTFDTFGSKKSINIDTAYMKYNPSYVNGLSLIGGKMDVPFWETQMIFDDDLTVEGFAEAYNHSCTDRYSVFAHLGQWVLDENNTTQNAGGDRGEDTYLFAYQIGHNIDITPKKLALRQAIGYYDYVNLEDSTTGSLFTGATNRNSLDGAGTSWREDFNIFAINNELKIGYFEKVPVRLEGEYIRNFAAAGLNQGFLVGATLWDAKKKGQYEVGYWYEEIQTDASFSPLVDSDFGIGGTNNRGHLISAKYYVTDWAYLKFSYWVVSQMEDTTQTAGATISNARQSINRVHVDVVMKF